MSGRSSLLSLVLGGSLVLALAAPPAASQCWRIKSALSDGPNLPVPSGPCTICGGSVYWLEDGAECKQPQSVLPPYLVTCQRGTCTIGPPPCLCGGPLGEPYNVVTSVIQCIEACPEGGGGPGDPGA